MSRDNPVVLRNGKVSVNCLDWPVSRVVATVSNSPTVSNTAWSKSSAARTSELESIAGARCSLTPTSSTGRSPTFFTVPLTTTLRSLVVVTVVGAVESMVSCRNLASLVFRAGARSLGWLDGAAHATAVVAGPKPTAAITRAATPARRSAILIRRPVPSGAVLAVFPFAASRRSSGTRVLRVCARRRMRGASAIPSAAPRRLR